MKILIVEDERILSKVLQDKFKEEGWSVDTAHDGIEAMDKIDKKDFDILLLDLIMPRMDGFEVIQAIRKSKTTRGLPIIVMSNLGDDDSIKDAFDLGASDYFVKNQHPLAKIVDRAAELVKK